MSKIRTIRGDINSEDAGVILTHEHAMFGWPGAEVDHRAVFSWDKVLKGVSSEFDLAKKAFNLGTFVDCTTIENARHPKLMQEVSERSGVHLIACTGFFCQSMGIPYHWRRQSVDEIAAFFANDITEGMAGTDVKCGVIKAASGEDDADPHPAPVGAHGRHLGKYEDRAFRAAARAQKMTGCPITTHIDPADWQVTNIGLEQLDLLLEEGGDPAKICIGHTFFASFEQLEEILELGAYVQMDNIGTQWRGLDDTAAIDLMYRAAEKGYEDRLLLTFDRFWYQLRGDREFTEDDPQVATRMPVEFLPDTFLPMMREKGFSEEQIHKIMVENPARFLAFG